MRKENSGICRQRRERAVSTAKTPKRSETTRGALFKPGFKQAGEEGGERLKARPEFSPLGFRIEKHTHTMDRSTFYTDLSPVAII